MRSWAKEYERWSSLKWSSGFVGRPMDAAQERCRSRFANLYAQGGKCTVAELKAALASEPRWREKTAGRGFFNRLLGNLRHSQQIEVRDGLVTMTGKSRRKIAL